MNAHAGTLFPGFWFDGNVALVCRITFQYSERGGRLRYSMTWFGRGQFKRWEIKVESCVYLLFTLALKMCDAEQAAVVAVASTKKR